MERGRECVARARFATLFATRLEHLERCLADRVPGPPAQPRTGHLCIMIAIATRFWVAMTT
jgi:hypothetical protein